MKKKRIDRKTGLAATFGVLLCLSLGVNAVQSAQSSALRTRLLMERQRDMADVVSAMADIEVNLQKLLLASGAGQSAELLGETALLAQHVETGLSRLPLGEQEAQGAMKFAGQMGEYVMTLAAQVSGGGMISTDDERQIEGLLNACQGLSVHLLDMDGEVREEDMLGGSEIEYPSLIYDGPFSDGRAQGEAKGLTGSRITREQARRQAARFAGVTEDRVRDAADSGGQFEAFGFAADTPDGPVSVQITGQGGHLLWMMPERAEFEAKLTQQECLARAQAWLEEMGFGPMQRCFVQAYDGMVVANFAAVQDGAVIYPDQVKTQVSMASGRVVGAECSMYLMNHAPREALKPQIGQEAARAALSSRLEVSASRLCVIPWKEGERLCWEFEGTFGGRRYFAYVDAAAGEAMHILRLENTRDGETAI